MEEEKQLTVAGVYHLHTKWMEEEEEVKFYRPTVARKKKCMKINRNEKRKIK